MLLVKTNILREDAVNKPWPSLEIKKKLYMEKRNKKKQKETIYGEEKEKAKGSHMVKEKNKIKHRHKPDVTSHVL